MGSRWNKHPAMRYSYPPAPPICRDQAPPMARLSHWAIALTINLSPSTDRPAIVKKTSFRATLGSSDHRGTFLRLSLVTCPIVRRAPRRSTSGSISSMPRPAIVRLDSSSTPSPSRMSTVIRVRARAPCHDHRWVIERRSGAFEPASFRDRYQDALRELVEAKTRGLATTPRAASSRPRSSM